MLIGRNNWRRWWDFACDCLFPKKCFGCYREGDWVCADCRPKLRIRNFCECPICRRPSPDGRACDKCRASSSLDGLWVVADYENILIKKIITSIKYQFIVEPAKEFDRLFENYFARFPFWSKDFLLVPVPLAKKRFLTRGFNQAELISSSLVRAFDNKITPLLRRNVYRTPQVDLDRQKRLENIRGSFSLVDPIEERAKDSRVVLVDDVYTTGATMQECAKVLKHAGFRQVWGVVIARN